MLIETRVSIAETHIKELCKYKDKLSASGGTIERLWEVMETKIGRGIIITLVIGMLGLLTTLYGLTYNTQIKILSEMSVIQTDIAVIKQQIKGGE